MHEIAIPQEIVERVRKQRGGRKRLFETLDMATVAHVVIDMQMGYTADDAPIPVPCAREIVPNINAISAAVREAGGVNAFIRFTYDPDEPRAWTNLHRIYMSAATLERTRATFSRGAALWQLHPDLDIAPADLVLDKTRFSAFVPGTCDLDAALRARGIETVVVTGAVTNCCCESTARDAMQMGYSVIFMADANAARSDAEHNAALASLASSFADVMGTRDLLALIAKSRTRT